MSEVPETPAPAPREGAVTLPLVFDEPRGRRKPPRHLADLTAAERKERLVELGLPGFRAKQLSTHYFARLVDDPAEMTDLPATQRDELVAGLLPSLMTPLRTMEADRGTTRKTLWKLFDGALVESVLMRYPDRATMCVSSQAGCGMACPFCATGQGGLQRNMSTAVRCPAARAASPTWCSWAWGSRWPTTRQSSAPYAASPTRRRTASGCRRAASPSRRSAWCPASTSS